MDDDHHPPAEPAARGELQSEADLPPVVARMVIEVRSDGTRTMARGALEDLVTGQNVRVDTPPLTPIELAGQLSKMLVFPTALAGGALRDGVRALMPERLRRLKRRILGSSQD